MVSTTVAKDCKIYLQGIYLNSSEKSAPLKIFLNFLIKSVEHQSEKYVAVAASDLISTGPSFFHFLNSIKLQQNIC